MQEEITTDAALTADVNAQPTVTLYDPVGRPVNVVANDVSYWLGLGFAFEVFNPDALVIEIQSLSTAVATAATNFAAQVKATGVVDTASDKESHLLEQALSSLLERGRTLLSGLHTRYPVAQPAEEQSEVVQ